jgi:hypothetical protein
MAFDDDFFQEILDKKNEFENFSFDEQAAQSTYSSEMLNHEFSSDAVDQSKLHKAYLQIPNEAMTNPNPYLCFKSGLNPTDWDFSDKKPIPKKDKDPCDPLSNCFISIICCVAKLYSKLLNTHLQKYFESMIFYLKSKMGLGLLVHALIIYL